MITFPWSLDKAPPPSIQTHHRRWQFFERHLPNISLGLMVLLLIAAVLYPHMVITVPSGHVGVLWKRFNGIGIYCWCLVGRGTVLNPKELREEGLHLIWPWDKLFVYDLRLQSATETFNAISSEGVSLTATMNIRYQLRHNSIAVLHKFIGPGYMVSVIRPEIGSRAREIIAKYTAEQVYSTSRSAIEDEIRDSAKAKLADHLDKLVQPEASEQADPVQYKNQLKDAIDFIDTLVLGIKLPDTIVGAINRKTEQFYLVKEYDFRVQREVKESERKQIEANGIAAFQRTIAGGITEGYLRWRGIDATLELAKSKNAKIVVIGSGKDGLPIILNNVDTPSPPEPAKPPTDAAPTAPDKTPTTNTPASPSTDAPAPSPPAKPLATSSATPPDTKPPPNAKTSNKSSDKSSDKDKDSSSPLKFTFSDVADFFSRLSTSFSSTPDPKPKPEANAK
jgi:regulator of protease activity HflC (stomatin/prohibitin superfamily)